MSISSSNYSRVLANRYSRQAKPPEPGPREPQNGGGMCDAQEWFDPYADKIPRALAGYANTAIRINDRFMRTGVQHGSGDFKNQIVTYDLLKNNIATYHDVIGTDTLGVGPNNPYGSVYIYVCSSSWRSSTERTAGFHRPAGIQTLNKANVRSEGKQKEVKEGKEGCLLLRQECRMGTQQVGGEVVVSICSG